VIPLAAAAFAYTPAPLQASMQSASVENGVRRTLVTFASGDRRLTAEIVAPAHATAHGPGVLFVHWLGDDATTNHKEFEPDARALAAKGATCVLLDAMWSTVVNGRRDWFSAVRSPDTDYKHSIDQVVDLRRSLDLLLAQPGVDPGRIAYVAHDFGAMYGAVLAGVDSRPRYYVLMAGTTSFADWYLLGKKPADVDAYRAQMAPLDPLAYLMRSTAHGFLFQFASHDQYVSAEHATGFFSAAPPPRAMYVYEAHHDLNVPLARHDRLDWLQARLF
jgi:dienelactone hydrolase